MERIIAAQSGNNGEKPRCPFDPPGSCSDSKADLLLYRDADRICLLNRFPYANGHLLLAPSRHVADLGELSPAERAGLMELVNSATAILSCTLHPDGFNIGINLGIDAGAGIPEHLHVHVVPRWRGDHNYLTVLAEIRTIPEHIEATFDRLLPHFRDLSTA